MELAPLIRDLALILGVAAVVTLIFHRIRQPVVLGYVVAGMIVGPYVGPRLGAALGLGPGAIHAILPSVSDTPNIRTWGELGVIFLMFSLGLDFSFRKLAKVGVSASITAVLEVSVMLVIGFALGTLLGWRRMDSIFLGAMLAISSTTILIKALDELKLKTRRFAEMIFGVLVVEDLIAILILVGLSTLVGSRAAGGFGGLAILLAAGKLVLVIGSWFLFGFFLLPRFVRYVGRLGSDEMLTILSLGLCLGLAVLAAEFHYSVALGAFIMGSILSESTESHRIEELMTPIKDVFAAIFFVSVGMLLDPRMVTNHAGQILVITLVYCVSKIVSVTFAALVTGQTLRTSVQVGFGLAQIGEFSFIIATLGASLNATSSFLFPVAVAVSLITTFMTPYLIRVSHTFAVALEKRLPIRVRDFLSRYAAWSQSRRTGVEERGTLYRQLGRWALNGILVSVAFLGVGEVLLPALLETLADSLGRPWARAIGWGAAVLVSAPFLWAMLSAFQGVRSRGVSVFVIRLLTGVWVGALSLQFFAAKTALALTAAFALALFAIFYRRLEANYRWFESHFLRTFESQPKSLRPTDVLKHLAPWDAHLVRIKVHPNADIAGKKIVEAKLRKRFGVNIVAIQRGLKTIVAPKPEEWIFPKDELLVLGTDEQIESIRFTIEKPPGLATRFHHISGYELRRLPLGAASPFAGGTIRQSGIGERFGVMVVGLERGDVRTMNPDSDTELLVGDVLWVVGETANLHQLFTESGA